MPGEISITVPTPRVKSVTVKHIEMFAKAHGLDMAVLFSWNAKTAISMVTTWGRTVAQCASAAESGNNLKHALGWPEELCNEIPPRMSLKDADKTIKDASLKATCAGPVICVTAEAMGKDGVQTVVLDLPTLRALTWKLRQSRKDMGWLKDKPQPPRAD